MGLEQVNPAKDGVKALRKLGLSVEEIIDESMKALTGAMVADAVQQVHVLTGNLQSSIDSGKVEEGHYQVRADASYAGYEEGGNRYRDGHPYLEPAVLAHLDDLDKIVRVKAERATKV